MVPPRVHERLRADLRHATDGDARTRPEGEPPYSNAWIPVIHRPMIRLWMSWVPS